MQHAAARKRLPSWRKSPSSIQLVQFAGLALAVIDGGGAYGSRAARRTWLALLGRKSICKGVAVALLTLGARADPWHFMLQPKVTQSLRDIFNCERSLATGNSVHQAFPNSESSLESNQESRHIISSVQTSPARSLSKCWQGHNLASPKAKPTVIWCHLNSSQMLRDEWNSGRHRVLWGRSLAARFSWLKPSMQLCFALPYYDFLPRTIRHRRWMVSFWGVAPGAFCDATPWIHGRSLFVRPPCSCRSVLHAEIGDRYCSLERSHCF